MRTHIISMRLHLYFTFLSFFDFLLFICYLSFLILSPPLALSFISSFTIYAYFRLYNIHAKPETTRRLLHSVFLWELSMCGRNVWRHTRECAKRVYRVNIEIKMYYTSMKTSESKRFLFLLLFFVFHLFE